MTVSLEQNITKQLTAFTAIANDLPTAAAYTALIEQLAAYLSLLHKWNQTYNLTAVRDLDAMVGRHILDSLAVLPWVHGPRVLDVGTGPGLPGIPLALANPDLHVVLLDSNGKKIRFLQEVKRQLSLQNVEVKHLRVEDYQPDQGFDTVVTRAFSSIQTMLTCTKHVLQPHGKWLAMKGLSPDDELHGIQYPYCIKTYTVPGVQGQRCCVILSQESAE